MAIKPSDMLPDDVDSTIIEGVRVRKGTVAAVLANLKALDMPNVISAEKEAIIQAIRDLAPALVVLGFKKYLTFNNPDIQKIVDEAYENLKRSQ
ncbi:MAG: hypothetical protein K0R66_867 [Gammaproteobacteria bacterium]|jgi:hypothetical protein|nr:hypothetical protein [Gammaproteobacteria bacterium]